MVGLVLISSYFFLLDLFQILCYLAPHMVADIKMVLNKCSLRKVGTVGTKGSCVQIHGSTQPESGRGGQGGSRGNDWDSHSTFALNGIFPLSLKTFTDVMKVSLKRKL